MQKVNWHEGDIVDQDWELALGRSAVYGFLAQSLVYPDAQMCESINRHYRPLLSGLTFSSSEVEAALLVAMSAFEGEQGELRRAHSSVFTHIENQDCPAHESAYSPGDVFRRADVMADIAAFYRAHGVKAGGLRRERVDHIATELEFLSFLARKEANAIANLGPAEIGECRRSQAHFLRDHVACWAPGFANRLTLSCNGSYLLSIGSLLGVWIEADVEFLGVEPAMQLADAQPPPPYDVGFCGADVGEGAIAVEIGKRKP